MTADRDVFERLRLSEGLARAVVRRAHVERLCQGHFPGDPLVPGAHLAGLMAALGARLLAAPDGVGPALAEIVRCAFLARVRPDAELTVLASRSGRLEVATEIRTAGTPAAEAVLRFVEPE